MFVSYEPQYQIFMKHVFFILLSFVAQMGLSQDIPLSSGGNAAGAGGTSTYSVGQVFYTSTTGTGGISNQGVQQPFEISTSGGEEITFIKLSMIAYPNPASSYLNLQMDNFEDYTFQNLHYQLLDIFGREIFTEKILASATSIRLENVVPATYILHIINEDKILTSFKIIKH
ncbi:MAG: T9SS type A sorting domain-containing protein [Saprospiraceae bacterium]|nr:T9SS type A sorting domain-containing protein [Saprospiraceae bacterium]